MAYTFFPLWSHISPLRFTTAFQALDVLHSEGVSTFLFLGKQKGAASLLVMLTEDQCTHVF